MSGTLSKRCPWCAEWIRPDALKCRYCGSLVESGRTARSLAQPWLRPVGDDRMLAGVCAGLAAQFGISVTLLRLAFVLGFIFSGGLFLLIYVILWIAMPAERGSPERSLEDLGP
jgi:phage shock protein PspC (stress-responsive transcriptional regulator)